MRRQKQRGITLILSLIMLVLLTIMALSAFHIGKGSLQVVDNAQQQEQVKNASQAMMDQVLSSPNFVSDPTNVLDNSNCPTDMAAPANSRCIDLYGDAKTVVLVQLTPTPTCLQVKGIMNSTLNVEDKEDLGCAKSPDPNRFGVEGTATDESLCSDSLWEITAQATERVSRAEAKVTQGVNMRVSNDAVYTACPTP
jgi:Tfp pilus assembly protein PilX